MTNGSIRQNLSAILPGNWSVMHFICLKKNPEDISRWMFSKERYPVHVPIGFQALCVYTTGELLSETIVATWAVRSKMVANPFSLHSNLLSIKNSHAHVLAHAAHLPAQCVQVNWTGVLLHKGKGRIPSVKNWAVSPPCVHQHPAGCRPRLKKPHS